MNNQISIFDIIAGKKIIQAAEYYKIKVMEELRTHGIKANVKNIMFCNVSAIVRLNEIFPEMLEKDGWHWHYWGDAEFSFSREFSLIGTEYWGLKGEVEFAK